MDSNYSSNDKSLTFRKKTKNPDSLKPPKLDKESFTSTPVGWIKGMQKYDGNVLIVESPLARVCNSLELMTHRVGSRVRRESHFGIT